MLGELNLAGKPKLHFDFVDLMRAHNGTFLGEITMVGQLILAIALF